jgi:hypothetical protein
VLPLRETQDEMRTPQQPRDANSGYSCGHSADKIRFEKNGPGTSSQSGTLIFTASIDAGAYIDNSCETGTGTVYKGTIAETGPQAEGCSRRSRKENDSEKEKGCQDSGRCPFRR